MKPLLEQILDKAKEKKFMFRCNAYQLNNYGCEEYVTDYHYDYSKIVDTLESVEMDMDNIHLIHESLYIPFDKKLSAFKKECLNPKNEYLDTYGISTLLNVFDEWQNADNKYLVPKGKPSDYHACDFADVLAQEMLYGQNHIRWINYGGNTGVDCFNDCDGEIYDALGLKELTDKFEKDFCQFVRY